MQSVTALLGLAVMVLLGLAGAAHAGATAATVPEPASMTVLAVGASMVAFVKFRNRK